MEVDGWRAEPAPRYQGNLFLTDSNGEPAAREGMRRQLELGCSVAWLDRDEVGERFAGYDGRGFVGGTLGLEDGSVDPSAVLQGYVRRSRADGVVYSHAEVKAIRQANGKVMGVELADGSLVTSPVVVNATGAWCAALAASAGVRLPVAPVMRTVFTLDTQVEAGGLPSVFLPSGLYLIPEHGRRFLCGWSQPDDPVGFDFTFRRENFLERLWPELGSTLPAFEAVHLSGGWVGLYEVNTLDENGIIGEWPELDGFYLANGFSGHGFQQCHAVGRHLAELILGRTPSLDLSRLSPIRLLTNSPLFENTGRII
jgi:glycine/D-amino acid oxidase-like deaminating enzyme